MLRCVLGEVVDLEFSVPKGKEITYLTTASPPGASELSSLERRVNPCRGAPSHFPGAPTATLTRWVSPSDNAACNIIHKHNIKVQAQGSAVIQQEIKCKVLLAQLFLLRPAMQNSGLQFCEVKLNFDASSRSMTPAKHNRATLD